jgi:hypothetical protein
MAQNPHPPDFNVVRGCFDQMAQATSNLASQMDNLTGVQSTATILAALQRIDELQVAFETRLIAS